MIRDNHPVDSFGSADRNQNPVIDAIEVGPRVGIDEVSPGIDSQHALGRAALSDTSGTTEEIVERKMLPPVDSIPSLFEAGIKGPDSMHGHKYDQSNTVWVRSCIAKDAPRSELTYQQVELLEDIKRLEAYSPYYMDYMHVYTPEELHALVGKLDLLRQKNRPDFNSYEAKIVDTVIRCEEYVTGDIVGIARRSLQNAEGRRGMQWATLNKLARAANNALASSMYKGDERRRYIIPIIRDPDFDKSDKSSIDLRDVYQFVATSHAFDMHGERSIGANHNRLETFENNRQIILDWYDIAKTAIDQLPRDRAWADSLTSGDEWYRGRTPARSGIQFGIAKLIEAMEERYKGGQPFGKFKSYKIDPAGAINLQLLIAHKVEAIRKKLGAGIHPADQEITPLEDFDF